MSQRFVPLKDVLGALEQEGPLSSDVLARRLRLSRLDARLVLVDAHAHGLVSTTTSGDWAITDLGRESLTMDADHGRHAESGAQGPWSVAAHKGPLRAFAVGARWRQLLHPRYLARRGLPLALGTVVCAGGVAVASSRLESSGAGPVIAPSSVRPAAHGRHAHARATRHLLVTGIVATRRHGGSTVVTGTGRVRHTRGHLLRRAPPRVVPQCAQHHRMHPGGAAATAACTVARRGHVQSAAGKSGGRETRRRLHNSATGGSDRGRAVSPAATVRGT